MHRLHPATRYLIPVHYQLAHWFRSDQSSSIRNANEGYFTSTQNSPKLAWTRFHLLGGNEVRVRDITDNRLLNLGQLVNDIARILTQVLRPHVKELRMYNCMQIALRTYLQPPSQVGYQLSTSASAQPILNTPASSPVINKLSNHKAISEALDRNLSDALTNWLGIMSCEFRENCVSGQQPILILELDFCLQD